MSRLPIVFDDNDSWGNILQEFLRVAHNEDGTLKSTVISGLVASAVLFATPGGALTQDSDFTYNATTDTLTVKNLVISNALTAPTLAIAGGGTGATTAAAARTNLSVPSIAETILQAIIDAKGDLIVGSAADTAVRMAVAADNKYLRCRAAATNGLEWEDVDRVKESGGQVLTLGSITDGQYLVRSGTTVIGLSFLGAMGTLSGAQSINTAAATRLALDTGEYNIGTMLDIVTNKGRFTVPAGKGGYWRITAQVVWAGAAGGGINYRTMVYKNGVEYLRATVTDGAAATTMSPVQPVGVTLSLAAADYIEIFVYQDSGAGMNVTAANRASYASLEFLGA